MSLFSTTTLLAARTAMKMAVGPTTMKPVACMLVQKKLMAYNTKDPKTDEVKIGAFIQRHQLSDVLSTGLKTLSQEQLLQVVRGDLKGARNPEALCRWKVKEVQPLPVLDVEDYIDHFDLDEEAAKKLRGVNARAQRQLVKEDLRFCANPSRALMYKIEAAEFLVAFLEAEGDALEEVGAVRDWERLMACDDMFLMRLVARRIETPEELDTSVLRKMQEHFAAAGAGGASQAA